MAAFWNKNRRFSSLFCSYILILWAQEAWLMGYFPSKLLWDCTRAYVIDTTNINETKNGNRIRNREHRVLGYKNSTPAYTRRYLI
jgi:hypothetical protein